MTVHSGLRRRSFIAMPRVGVVGGSIGGLTAALVLRDLGCEVDVFERSGTALEARGAGIGLHPMTTRYFSESSELDAAMVEIELPWLQFLSASGDRIYQERMNYRFSSWNTIYRGSCSASTSPAITSAARSPDSTRTTAQ